MQALKVFFNPFGFNVYVFISLHNVPYQFCQPSYSQTVLKDLFYMVKKVNNVKREGVIS